MNIDKIAAWLLDWFKKRGAVSGGDINKELDMNYFELGLIDSLGVMELITSVEKYFGVRFTPEHFQDRRFSKIKGLAEMISELLDHTRKSQMTDKAYTDAKE